MSEYVALTRIDYGTEVQQFQFNEGDVVDGEVFGDSLRGLVDVKALRPREEEEAEVEEEPEPDPDAKSLSGLPAPAVAPKRSPKPKSENL